MITFDSKKVFDTLMENVSEEEWKEFLDVNYLDTTDVFFEECNLENGYDIYEAASDAIFEMGIYDENGDDTDRWNNLIKILSNGDEKLYKRFIDLAD